MLLLLSGISARAQARHRDARAHSEFWSRARVPELRRVQTLMQHGTFHMQRASRAPSRYQRTAWIENAIARFAVAHELAPDVPRPLYLLAIATSQWQLENHTGAVERRDREAVAMFHQLRAMAPDFEAEIVAFELGVLHTRTRSFALAAREYERSIQLSLSNHESAVAQLNLAEVTMLAGDVARAVTQYERAILLSRSGGALLARNLTLSLWGCAVALDRAGEHSLAIQRAKEALSAGGGTMAPLRGPSVFYEPEYEIYAYEALGHMAEASQQTDPNTRRSSWKRAIARWTEFLRSGGRDSAWADLARDHRTRLEQLATEHEARD